MSEHFLTLSIRIKLIFSLFTFSAWKVSAFGVSLVRIFSAFGLNTEKYGVSLRIQSECGKIRTRKTPNTDTFHAVIGLAFSFRLNSFSYSILTLPNLLKTDKCSNKNRNIQIFWYISTKNVQSYYSNEY